MTDERYHHLGPALSTWGNVALYHVIGHTPEVRSSSDFCKGIESSPAFRNEDLESFYEEFSSSAQGRRFVIIGCPHCTMRELEEISEILAGKQIRPEHALWIMTNRTTWEMAKKIGYIGIIERAGGKVLLDMCWILSGKTDEIFKMYDTIMTDSSKGALFSRSAGKQTVIKDKAKCIGDLLLVDSEQIPKQKGELNYK